MKVTIPTNSERSLISGRNGCYPIKAIEVWEGNGNVFIDGIGRRGKAIKGGLIVTASAFTELCRAWLGGTP